VDSIISQGVSCLIADYVVKDVVLKRVDQDAYYKYLESVKPKYTVETVVQLGVVACKVC
jgi:hypothetical protein